MILFGIYNNLDWQNEAWQFCNHHFDGNLLGLLIGEDGDRNNLDKQIKNAQYSDSDDESLMVWSGAPCYKKGYGWYIGYSLGDADDYYMPHDEDQIHITFEKMKSIYPKIKHLTNDDIPRLHVWKDRV